MMLLGKFLLTFTLIAVTMGPLGADLNETHIFNPNWEPHARFHNAVGLFQAAGLTILGLWLLWKKSLEFKTNLFVAMMIPVLAWGSFFPALLIPGAGAEDVAGTLPRVLGLPLNLFVALLFVVMSVSGYLLCLKAYNEENTPSS